MELMRLIFSLISKTANEYFIIFFQWLICMYTMYLIHARRAEQIQVNLIV